SLLMVGDLQGQGQKLVRRRGVGDLDGGASTGLDELVTQGLHPAVAARPQELLKGVSLEALGTNPAPNANIHEHRGGEPPTGFNSTHGFEKLRRGVAPAIVAPSKESRGIHSFVRQTTVRGHI